MPGPQVKMMVMNRNLTHASRLGHSIRFEKNVPVAVPLILLSEVMAIGAIPADGEVPVEPEVIARKAPESQPERDAMIRKAMERIVQNNNSVEFTTAGIPHTRVIINEVGFEVTTKERDRVWQTMQEEKLSAQLEAEAVSRKVADDARKAEAAEAKAAARK